MGDCTLQEILDAIALANGFNNLTQEQCDRLKLGFEAGKLNPYVLNFYLWATLGGKFPAGSTCTVQEIFDAIALQYGFNNLTTQQCDLLKAGYSCGSINAEIMNFLFWSAATSLRCPTSVPMIDTGAGDIAGSDFYVCTDIGGAGTDFQLRQVDAPSNDLDLDLITIRKTEQQAQIWDSPPTNSNPTAVVTPNFELMATDVFDFDPVNNSFNMKAGKGGTYALLLRYLGSGWDGGSTGVSYLRVSVNPTPILVSPVQKVTAAGGPPGEVANANDNFPTGAAASIESGSAQGVLIPDGYSVQLWTEYAGNDGGGSNIGGVVSNIPNNLELAEVIFIRTGA